jgi:phosphate transport system permease protein
VTQARSLRSTADGGDRVFGLGLRAAGVLVLLIMATIGLFLMQRGWPALREAGWSFLTVQAWEPASGNFGIAAILVGTVLIAAVAVTIAVPLATGVALYISEYAPGRVRGMLINVVDLMAAVPSVVYGLWGVTLMQVQLIPVAQWLSVNLGWIPFLSVSGTDPNNPLSSETVYKSSTFDAGVVVAMMIMPIICSVMREGFSQAPLGEREGAYALGATRWGMIRVVVLPFGRGAMIGGTMLGLGRALGETIAILMIITPVFAIQTEILRTGAISVSSLIALRWGEASPFSLAALMAAGLALFALTLVVNFVASAVINRTRSGQMSEA